jgi:hypothetical protein
VSLCVFVRPLQSTIKETALFLDPCRRHLFSCKRQTVMKMTVSLVPHPSFRHHDHLSTSASPVIAEEARAFGFTDYRSRSHRQARNPALQLWHSARWPVLSKCGSCLPTGIPLLCNKPCEIKRRRLLQYHGTKYTHVNLRKSCMFVLLNVVGVTIGHEARHSSKTPATTVTPTPANLWPYKLKFNGTSTAQQGLAFHDDPSCRQHSLH